MAVVSLCSLGVGMQLSATIWYVIGSIVAADATYVMVKRLLGYVNICDVLMFGEKYDCKSKNCTNPCCSFHNLERLTSLMNSAQYSLDICVYMLTNNKLCARLLEAHQRGVKVRVITDISEGVPLPVQVLVKAGIAVGWMEASKLKLMHHKFCIIDGQSAQNYSIINKYLDKMFPPVKDAVVIAGSFNWTNQSTSLNYENVLITNDPVVHLQYQGLFENISRGVLDQSSGC